MSDRRCTPRREAACGCVQCLACGAARRTREECAKVARAESAEVAADRFEAKGNMPTSRALARDAAELYDRLGWNWFGRCMPPHGEPNAHGYRLAGDYWDRAARAYRRGKSHARAGATSGRARQAWAHAARLMVRHEHDPVIASWYGPAE